MNYVELLEFIGRYAESKTPGISTAESLARNIESTLDLLLPAFDLERQVIETGDILSSTGESESDY